ncbi:MAG: hypothetical protein KF817_04070 [Phycisphaeraceae bacterium]|nr:hypothetical protein [Phycisphaeraceae bacterium]
MSNLRPWGIATMMHANLFQETVPREGTKEADLMSFCFYRNGNPSNGIERGWWANALPRSSAHSPARR